MKRVAASDIVQDFYDFMDDAVNLRGWGEPTADSEIRTLLSCIRDLIELTRDIERDYPEVDLMDCRIRLAAANSAATKALKEDY